MSDPGSPSDPFGRSERTIIRPNPGGRRVPPPAQAPAQAPASQAAPQPYTPPSAPSPGVPGSGDEWMSPSAPVAPQPVAAPAAAPAPVAPDTGAMLDQLRQLGELRAAGVLTDAEFEAQKARILAS